MWPEAGYGWAPSDLKYRWHWNFPLSFSPHVAHRVYVGSQFVHMSDDGGQSWKIISPDLTLNDKTHQQSSGGVAIDNLMTFDGSVLFAIEESKLEAGLIWVGSNDGQVNITMDNGKNWSNVTENIPDLPPWGTIANIHPSVHQKGAAYLTVDLHQMGDFDPYVYKTTDYGDSWRLVSNSVPKSVHSFAHVIKEDPKKEGMLYLGVDNGIYISHNDGQNWMRFKNNLPPAPVYWITIQEHFDDLVVGTYGRGFYILDDLAPLREFVGDVPEKDVHLFSLRSAYRFNQKESIKTDGPSFNSGRNPRYGSPINYYLKDSADVPVEIQVLNAGGEVIRTLEGKNDAGINRLWWDLRYEPTFKPRLRTLPPGRPWVQLKGEGWRPLVTWDLDLWRGQFGPRVVPGNYTIKLKVGEEEFYQALEVKKDPRTMGTIETIQEQVEFSLQLRDAMNLAVNMINKVEILRRELEDLIPELKSGGDLKEAQRLKMAAVNVAGKLYDIHLTGAREDAFRSPMKLYGRLSALASDINASGIDFIPTNQQGEVYQVLNGRLQKVISEIDELIEEDINAFNQKLEKSQRKIDLEKKGNE